MAKSRQLTRDTYKELKRRSSALVDLCGGIGKASELTRGAASRMSEAVSPFHDDRYLAIDQILDLENLCGMAVVTKFLAEAAGFELVVRERKAWPEVTLPELLAEFISACALVSAELAAALGTAPLDDAKRRLLVEKIAEARRMLDALETKVRPEIREGAA